MKNSLAHHALLFAAALAFAAFTNVPAAAQSTAFTYQGLLNDAGTPAAGLHDLQFRLYSVASGGVPIGSTLCVDNVSVVEGVFTVQLDFGQQFATTAQRFLEIDVRRDTGLDCAGGTGFVVMVPRQPITSTPMASHAKSAFALDAADGSPASAVFVDNQGNVGLGTTSPAARLHLQGTAPVMLLQDTASPSNQSGYISFLNNSSATTGWLGFGTVGSPEFSIFNARTGGDLRLYTSGGDINLTPGPGGDINLVAGPGRFVGIGTYTPAATLDVRGDIRLGSSGQFQAAAGEENLRIVRGTIDRDGTPLLGCCYSVSHPSASVYDVAFATPFAAAPSVTASAHFSSTLIAGFGPGSLPTASGFRIITGGGESEVYFIAVGPR